MTTTDELGEEYRTRPGTPMIGVYSVNQMDDFYTALAAGEVKPTGIMNYLQRLLITQRCRPGDRVLDVCCGRGLQLPVLYRYRPDLATYVGLDISAENLAEATARQATLDAAHPRGFSIEFHQCDVAAPWPEVGSFDVVVYTSALEHLPHKQGITSLRNTAAALAVAERYGGGAAEFYRAMREFAPDALLGPVVATALGEAASEVLYICSRRLG